jgi:hypothetical protein
MRYVPDGLRPDLVSLADALLPLADWLKADKKYVPPNADELPWRQNGGPPLNAKTLRVIDFLDGLIAETSGDVDLLDRFGDIAKNPLGLSPLSDVHDWRAARGLDDQPAFGVVASNNVLIDASGNPFARATFYKTAFDAFQTAAGNARLRGPIDWARFADALWVDASPFWTSTAMKASAFVTQFLKDVLYAVLSMRGPASEPLNSAVPTELGEHRRPGNRFEPDDAEDAVEAFRAKMAEVAKHPPAPTPAPHPPPVGSPPATTKPEHRQA